MRRPLSDIRPFGPLFSDNSNISGIGQNGHVFKSDSDVERVANAVIRRTPAILKEAKYQGYFSTPSAYFDFSLPSSNPFTITRDYFSSSITANAETGNIKELSIRFPAVEATDVEIEDMQKFVERITPDIYRVRIQYQEHVDGDVPELHPHVHYSTARRGQEGPYLPDEALNLNRMIKAWYSQIDTLFN